tara:strand:- start:1570 stop:2727 length:1158 start_codon:yes stop_codon:yes gene_type:complete
MKSWKLNESNFTILDRLKLCRFFLSSNNFWTMSSNVNKFEKEMAKFSGSKYALFVSSGSTANTILAYYLKDYYYKPTEKNVILFPSTTWVTSVSPFIREGFDVKFIDISLNNYAMDLDRLEDYLEENHQSVRCLFLTSLLGFNPDFNRLSEIKSKYEIEIMLDNCENTFSEYKMKNASSYFTSTTSTYFGHQLQSVEGGFIFTNSKEERDLFSMYRNHGMTRSIEDKEKYLNKDVDPRFDFYLLGNNSRNSDIHAFIGLLDLKRKQKYVSDRLKLFSFFKSKINCEKIKLPKSSKNSLDVPFCIPLIFNSQKDKDRVLSYCETNNIETRPVISGNLLRQTCFKKYGNPQDFINSEYIHQNGFYVGLHSKVKEKQIEKLTSVINNL